MKNSSTGPLKRPVFRLGRGTEDVKVDGRPNKVGVTGRRGNFLRRRVRPEVFRGRLTCNDGPSPAERGLSPRWRKSGAGTTGEKKRLPKIKIYKVDNDNSLSPRMKPGRQSTLCIGLQTSNDSSFKTLRKNTFELECIDSSVLVDVTLNIRRIW